MSPRWGNAEQNNPTVIPAPQSISDAAAHLDREQGRAHVDSPVPQLASPTAKREIYQVQAKTPSQLRSSSGYRAAPIAQVSSGVQGMAKASLVLGFVAFFTVIFTGLGLLVGGLAVALGVVARRNQQRRGIATAGIAVGAFSAVASVLMFVVPLAMGGITWDGTAVQIGGGSDRTTYGSAPVPDEFAVADKAFGPSSSDPTATWFVVIIHNPRDQTFELMDVWVVARDATGNELGSALKLPDLPPGDMALSGEIKGVSSDQIASLVVQGDALADSRGSNAHLATVSNVTSEVDGGTVVTGTVTYAGSAPMLGGSVTVVARDPSGKISGVAHTETKFEWTDEILSQDFRVAFDTTWPEGTTYEVYAAPR